MQPQPDFSANQDPNVVCAQCGAPMPKEMRFCRSCGNRLGEGPAEYTETVRFPNAQTTPSARGTTPFYAAPIAQASGRTVCRRRRVRGMTWVWIVIAIFFATGGGLSALMKNARHIPRAVAPLVSRSFAGVDEFKAANGGVTFDVVEPPGSPADKAGLVGGDIITSFDGQSPQTRDEMMDLLRRTSVGKTVEVIFTRDGSSHKTQLTTISEDEYNRLGDAFDRRPEGKGRFGFETFRTKRINDPETKTYGVRLNWVDPNSPADLFGIKEGDIITEFDNAPIRTSSELLSRVRRAIPKTPTKVVVLRDGQRLEIPVTLARN